MSLLVLLILIWIMENGLIYPDKLGILQRGLSSTMTINDNVYTRTKWIYTFMSEPTMALLGYCATFRYCDFSLHFEMAPHDIIKRDIDKTINNLNKNLNKEKECFSTGSNRKRIGK